jgi:hypothetical protein
LRSTNNEANKSYWCARQRVRFIERSEVPQKLHVRLGERRWLIEVRLIAEHCCSGVNEPDPSVDSGSDEFRRSAGEDTAANVVLTVLCLSEEWPRMTFDIAKKSPRVN